MRSENQVSKEKWRVINLNLHRLRGWPAGYESMEHPSTNLKSPSVHPTLSSLHQLLDFCKLNQRFLSQIQADAIDSPTNLCVFRWSSMAPDGSRAGSVALGESPLNPGT